MTSPNRLPDSFVRGAIFIAVGFEKIGERVYNGDDMIFRELDCAGALAVRHGQQRLCA